jgi:hypothetical protein
MLHGIFDSVEWGKIEQTFRTNYRKASPEEQQRLKTWLLNQSHVYKKLGEAQWLIKEVDQKICATA